MIRLDVKDVHKTFGKTHAVDGVSLDAQSGEVFAVLGPNGAGKTTLIRMIMDITRPDGGSITFDGGPISDDLKQRTGYMPEERGLYKKQKVGEIVTFFGRLHGMDAKAAAAKTTEWLERMGLGEWEKKNVDELSKGMQQKAQLGLTLLHDPDLVILDEPFSGLDPVNIRMVKEVIGDLRERGKTILLCTHQMAQVEALADRVFMISHGRRVLYGTLSEIKKEHSENAILVNPEVDPTGVDGVLRSRKREEGLLTKIWLEASLPPREFLLRLLDRKQPVERFELAETPLEDIFVKLANEPVHQEVMA